MRPAHVIAADRAIGRRCAVCHGQGDLIEAYEVEEAAACPGPPPAVPPGATLHGTPPPVPHDDGTSHMPDVRYWR